MRIVHLRKVAIILLIAVHLAALLLEVAPFKHGKAYPGQRLFSYYLQSTGLWQDWSMFSPDPLRINVHVEARIRYQNGDVASYTLPRLHLLPRHERVLFERYRKWSVDWLRMDDQRHIWGDAGRFILNRLPPSPGNPPVSIALLRFWHEIEDPEVRFREWGYRIPVDGFNSFEFHSQALPSKGVGK